VDAQVRLPNDAELLSLFPHMHLRGKAFEYRASYTTGETQTLLRVEPYVFNWQLSYKLEKPVPLPAGTRLESSAWFDNSPNNKNNPDPTAEVRWGEQSWEEMMVGFVDIAFDAAWSRRDFITPRKPANGAGN
jgi:hypothetical protein